MTTRRSLLAFLAGLPLVGRLFAAAPAVIQREANIALACKSETFYMAPPLSESSDTS